MGLESTIKRESDELWTSYLIRRLKVLGKEMRDGGFERYGHLEFVTRIDIDDERYIHIARDLPDPENITPEFISNLTYFTALFMEQVSVCIIPDRLDIDFFFHHDGKVSFLKAPRLRLEGLFAKYQRDSVYKAEDVIEDIVQYAKNPDCCSGTYVDD